MSSATSVATPRARSDAVQSAIASDAHQIIVGEGAADPNGKVANGIASNKTTAAALMKLGFNPTCQRVRDLRQRLEPALQIREHSLTRSHQDALSSSSDLRQHPASLSR